MIDPYDGQTTVYRSFGVLPGLPTVPLVCKRSHGVEVW